MLNVSHVTKKYGKVTACDDLSFHLDPGTVTVLLGPSGAGKSTIFKAMIGFLKYEGEIRVKGLSNKTPEARRLLGYIPEMPSLYPNLTVSEHMEFIARAYKLGGGARRDSRNTEGNSGGAPNLVRARKTFSTLGFGCFAILVTASVLQIVAAMLFPEWLSTSWGLWIYTFAPLYVIAVPVGLLIFRCVPAHSGGMYSERDYLDEDDRECQSNSEKEESVRNTGAGNDDIGSKSIFTKKNAVVDKIDSMEKNKKQGGSRREKRTMKPSQLVRAVFIAIFLMYAGNILGNLVTAAISALTGTSAEAAITTYALADSLVLKILFMVILAPLIEEYVFRRQLIDRMSCYGEKLAVVTSALMFGLFHGNFTQFFYAFALGLLFGYIYLKTGKLRYSAGLHMGINFLGSIVPSALLNMLDLSALESLDSLEMLSSEAFEPMLLQLALYGGYVVVLLVSSIVGLVLLCRGWRRVSFERTAMELPKDARFRTVYLNAGMIVFVLSCVALIVFSVFA